MSTGRALRRTIRLSEIAKQFVAGTEGCRASVTALEGASVDIRGGEILLLCGPPGSGKTTLMLCAAGLLHFDGGEVERGIRRVMYRDLGRGDATVGRWPQRGAILLDACDAISVSAGTSVRPAIADALASGSAIVLAGRDAEACLALAPDAATISVLHLRRGVVVDAGVDVAVHRVAEAARGSY
jgi:energy-coupling factor transporter ATP-binding protein EcfA2